MLTTIARRTGIILIAAATVLPLAAYAQQTGDKNSRQPNDTRGAARSADRPSGMKPCPEYGAGFYKVDGSDTCVRIGGGVGIDVGGSGGMGGRR